jgi:hypothetical protein
MMKWVLLKQSVQDIMERINQMNVQNLFKFNLEMVFCYCCCCVVYS